jgi:integrase
MEITVYVFKRKDRTNYTCQWSDPVTGEQQFKSTGTPNRRKADVFAGELKVKLEAGKEVDPLKTEWKVLADRYEQEYLSSIAKRTRYKFQAIRRHVERLINPKYVTALSSSVMSTFQQQLRNEGMAEATIKSSLSSLRACLNWGKHEVEIVHAVPKIKLPTRVNKSKGRPLTEAEFKRMLDVAPDEVGAEFAPSIIDTMTGLWFSSLRIEEALRLTWEPTADGFNLECDPDGSVRIRIESLSDKSTEVRYMPLPPDFQRFILSTPEDAREGFVFDPRVAKQKTVRMRADTCSKIISRIGQRAEIVVATYAPKPGETEPRVKYASAHDFRRSFADRHTEIVTEEQLQEMMRHKSIKTTRDHYAKRKAKLVEKAIAKAMQQSSDISSDILPFRRTG